MHTSARIASSRPLATTAMHGRVEALRAEGQPVIDFSIAISHFPAPRPVLDAVAHAVERERTMPYTSVVGALDVREARDAVVARDRAVVR